jgi:hypothetical protein
MMLAVEEVVDEPDVVTLLGYFFGAATETPFTAYRP